MLIKYEEKKDIDKSRPKIKTILAKFRLMDINQIFEKLLIEL